MAALSSSAGSELCTVASRSVSPGAALLRSSRMFSIPNPIPPPPGDYSAATRHYSPTATANYPTRLTVTTTTASRINGDWGFKRPLPLKTTANTTYPLVRVKQVDSTEQVTDYQSASDHTLTLRKFQELNLPLTVPASSNTAEAFLQAKHPKSVFEENGDVTALNEEEKARLANQRWKFTGPWLAGMTDGAFKRYLEKKVRNRRPEFRTFLKKTLAAEMTADRTRAVLAAGQTVSSPVSVDEITEDQFMDYLKKLREDRLELYNLVSQFLDLAPVGPGADMDLMGYVPMKPHILNRGSPYGANGPPVTHPSGGLSYLRTRNFQENHPLYGPQLHHAAVEARVLKPTNFATGSTRPTIGVAGFVGNTPEGDTVFNTANSRLSSRNRKLLTELDLEKPGGAKIYVSPSAATIDSSGRVRINIGEASHEDELVQRELVGQGAVFEELAKVRQKPKIPLNPNTPSSSFGTWGGNRIIGSATSYGLNRTP